MGLLKKTFLFLLVAVMIYLLAFFVLANLEFRSSRLIYYFDQNLAPKGTVYRAFVDKESNGPFDALVFGSSHAFRGYDPRIFEAEANLNLFNCGTSAQSMPNTYHYLKDQYEAMPTDLVILDVFVDIFNYKELESSIMLVRNTDSDRLAWEIVKDEKDIRLLNIFCIRHLALQDTSYYRNPQYIRNGYISKSETMTSVENEPYEPFSIDSRTLDRFRQLLDYAQSVDMNLVLVNQPRPEETNAENNKEFSALIEKELEGYDFKFLDYSMDHDLDTKENYYDLGHMNQQGVEYFNRRLLKDLRKNNLIKIN